MNIPNYLTKVTVEDFKVKQRRLHSCEQNLALLILRRLEFLK